VTFPDSSVVDFPLLTNRLLHLGSTTVSNGTLKVVAPNHLTNSPGITLAGVDAVLDVTALGYATQATTLDINGAEQPTNTIVVTTGTLEIPDGQSLNGHGTILGNLHTDPAAVVNVGLGIGTLSISGTAELNCALNMDLNRTNGPTYCDRIAATVFTGSGATLTVSNSGPANFTAGDRFQLFSQPVANVTLVGDLPALDCAGLQWTNKLAVDGTLAVIGTPCVNLTPTNIMAVMSGGNLDISWPADQIGWTLLSNSVDLASANQWFPVPGSSATNRVIITPEASTPNVFFRLRSP
jgi:hypothetical protein